MTEEDLDSDLDVEEKYRAERYNNTYALTYDNEFGDHDTFFYDMESGEYTVARDQQPDPMRDFEIMTAFKIEKERLPAIVRDYFDSLVRIE